LVEHMVEEADAGRDFRRALAVEVDRNGDLGFLGLARDARFALGAGHAVRPFLLLGESLLSACPADCQRAAICIRRPRAYISLHAAGAALPRRPAEGSIGVDMSNEPTMHATTIVTVRKNDKVVIAGDGQVSLGQTVMKGNARKMRRLGKGNVIAGFAGATADALTLLERLEAKLKQYPDQLTRACVELAKDWRTDRYLRRLEAMMLVADKNVTLALT